MSLYNELKRRNVLRVGAAYIVAAWLVIQVVETIFPAFGFSDAAIRTVVIVLAIAFIPSLILSWVFEITPEGMKREVDVVRDDSTTYITGKRLDRIIMVLLAMALGYFAFDKFVLDPVRDDQIVETAHQEGRSEALVESYGDKSIAVLAFVNMSDDAGNEYFSDGISEEILNLLTKIPELRVISRSSAFSFKGKETQIPEIAKILNVAHILEGSVRKAGNQVRITAQLIDARSDTHLWSETYDRELASANIFAIQSEIAQAIAEALKTTLSPAEQQRIVSVPTDDIAAYEAFLFGRQRLARRSTDGLAESAEYFRKAVELDPGFALAWVGLADAYQLQADRISGLHKHEMFAKAEAALETALKLDNKLGEAYTSLGLLRLQQKDLEGAEQSFKRALELYPNYPPLNLWYGMLLEDLGRWDEALARKAAAVKLDPMSATIRRSYAISLRGAGRYEEALDELETVLEIDPNFVPALDSIATIQWQVFNQHEKAVQSYVNVITLDPKSSDYYVWLGGLYLDLGEPGRADQLFDHAIELAPNSAANSWGVLLLQLYRGNYGATVDPARMILTDWGPNQLMGQFSAAQIRNHALAEGRDTEALAIYSETYPQLLTQDKPVVDLNNYRAAIDLALVLGNEGDQKRADLLLESSLAFISTQPRLGLWGGFWVADVQVLALQGKNQEAIAALQQAADDGWRSLWWYYLQYDPNLNSIRGEPEFQIVVAEIQADMASQMQRVREMEQSGEIGPVPGVVIEPK